MPRWIGLNIVCGCVTALLLAAFFAQPAGAVTIDKELLELIGGKASGTQFQVLMVYEDSLSVDGDLLADLTRLSPEKKRRKVLALLKKKSKKIHARATAAMYDENGDSRVENLVDLYLANAMAFEADADLIFELGNLDDQATLFHNKTYLLKTGLSKRKPTDEPKVRTDVADTVWSVKYIRADEVWRDLGYTGTGVIVGHIDSGVFLGHQDLYRRIWINSQEVPSNGIDDDGNGYVDDIAGWDFGDMDNNPQDDSVEAGHGTHTAGTVAGDGSGGMQTGVAPGARIMPCKVFDSSGLSTLSMMWEAQQYCVENGAHIITMSMGITGSVPASYQNNDRINAGNMRDAGVIIISSSGNDHLNLDPPVECLMSARIPSPWVAAGVRFSQTGGVVAVGATRFESDEIYLASSQGPTTWQDIDPFNDWPLDPGVGLIKPDIVAPGNLINSLAIPSGYTGNLWNGTSMACPHIAGVAALMLEKNPSLSPVGVDSLLQLTARDLGDPGKDNVFGAGLIDAYAAVEATPELQLPYLLVTKVVPDPVGDGALDPGESSKFGIVVANNSTLNAADDVEGHLAVVPNPYVTIIDGSSYFGDISPHGGTADNLDNPFGLQVAADTPDGFEFTILLTLIEQSGFQRTYDLDWYVGQPLWRTHAAGDVYLTVTGQGILGYPAMQSVEGDGMGYGGHMSDLFLGSFWGGTDADYICNRDYTGFGLEVYEWVSRTTPTGRVRDLSTGDDEVFAAAFTDSGHAEPRGIVVEQTSYAYASELDAEFVILEYKVSNTGTVDMPEYFAGVFCDFDVGDTSHNDGGTDETHNLVYINDDGGPYFGIALLGTGTALNTTLISNPVYIYPGFQVQDQDKIDHLNGLLKITESTQQDDWSALVSTQLNLPAGTDQTVAFALVYGATLEDLLINTENADLAYAPISGFEQETPRGLVRLQQNWPNPFNPKTEISFSLPVEGAVELDVYDIQGRLVRTLVNRTLGEGDHRISWNGTNDAGARVPSGVYFYKLRSGEVNLTRKMTLLK